MFRIRPPIDHPISFYRHHDFAILLLFYIHHEEYEDSRIAYSGQVTCSASIKILMLCYYH